MFRRQDAQEEMVKVQLHFCTRELEAENKNVETKCRCRLLFQDFLLFSESSLTISQCNCCDVCQSVCMCDHCLL